MALLIQLVLVGILILIVLNIVKMLRGDGAAVSDQRGGGPMIEGAGREVSSPGHAAATTLKEFENARAALKARYPTLFAMFGGYLNTHTIGEAGSIEAAVKEMISDWTARKEEVSRELTHLLAENEEEEDVRAIILAACDADFENEGYRAWATWLLGAFNDFS